MRTERNSNVKQRSALHFILMLIFFNSAVAGATDDIERKAIYDQKNGGVVQACIFGGTDNRLQKCKLAAEAGNGDSALFLGNAYKEGMYGAEKNYTDASHWFLAAAKEGLAEGQEYMGMAYLCGVGVPQDANKSRAWFEKASGSGKTLGLTWMGLLDEKGIGGAKNEKSAIHYFQMASAQNDGVASLKLAIIYLDATSGSTDIDKGLFYLDKARWEISFNSVYGMYAYSNIGKYSTWGDHSQKKIVQEKLADIRGRAEGADAQGEFDLGVAFFYGFGVPVDSEQALV